MNKKLIKIQNEKKNEIEDLSNRQYHLENGLRDFIDKLKNAKEVLERLEGTK